MSSIGVDTIREHTAGAGVEITNTLRARGFVMQPDELDTDMTVPAGQTLYVQGTLAIAVGKTLTVEGTAIVS